MDKFEEVNAKDIKSGSIEKYPDKFITQVDNNKITVTKDGIDIEANSVTLDGKVSVK